MTRLLTQGAKQIWSSYSNWSLLVSRYELQIVQPAIKGPAELTEEQEEEKDDNGNKKGSGTVDTWVVFGHSPH